MFDKIKQIQQLKTMQSALKKEVVTIEEQGVKITINGNLEVQEIVLNPDLEKEVQEQILKNSFNKAVKQVQMKMAQQFSGMF